MSSFPAALKHRGLWRVFFLFCVVPRPKVNFLSVLWPNSRTREIDSQIYFILGNFLTDSNIQGKIRALGLPSAAGHAALPPFLGTAWRAEAACKVDFQWLVYSGVHRMLAALWTSWISVWGSFLQCLSPGIWPLEARGECTGTCTVHSVYVKCIVWTSFLLLTGHSSCLAAQVSRWGDHTLHDSLRRVSYNISDSFIFCLLQPLSFPLSCKHRLKRR